MALDPVDRLDLADLYARYAHCFDEGQAEAWAALFAPDGTFGVTGGAQLRGTAELAAFGAKMHSRNPGIRHLVSGVSVEPAGAGARGRAYVVVLVPAADGPFRTLTQGTYEDGFVRLPAGWRFQRRTFTAWSPGG